MTNLKVTQGLAIMVTLTGLVVMFGWYCSIPGLTSILPHWVTMKFSTAVCFVLSGLTLFLIATALQGHHEVANVIIPIGAGGIWLLMGSLLASTLLGVHTGIEDLFVQETEGAVMTTTPGRPSVSTMLDFILVAAAGLVTMLNPEESPRYRRILGYVVGATGFMAVCGYILNQPALYFTWTGFSTAMALHTAILFVLLAIGLVYVDEQRPGRDPG